MKKLYIVGFLISIGLFYWIFKEYFDQLEAYNKQTIIHATIIDINCHKRSNIKIQTFNSSDYISLTRKECDKLHKNDRIELIKSKTGQLYWNRKPTSRVFWLIPIYLILVGYIFYWHHQKRIKNALQQGVIGHALRLLRH